MSKIKLTLKRTDGAYIVKRLDKGTEHVFDTLHDALDFIGKTHFINKPIGRRPI